MGSYRSMCGYWNEYGTSYMMHSHKTGNLGKNRVIGITVRNTLSALIWYKNQVYTPTFWDVIICVKKKKL